MIKDMVLHHDWTVVEFDVPKWVMDRVAKEREIRTWCDTHFPHGRWQVFSNRAYFQKASDAVFFKMVWS
jgi:hypothetical protein